MIVEIISIGDEVIAGNILDTNKQYLSDELWQRGYRVEYHTGVRDDEGAITDALLRAAERADAIMCTGGLGPTVDDFTIEIAAKAFGVGLVMDDQVLSALKERLSRRGRELTENNKKQALIPEGAQALSNAKGTAPGVYYCYKKKPFFFMPGVPVEMRYIFKTHVLDLLKRHDSQTLHFETRFMRTFGCAESELDLRLQDLMTGRSEIGGVRIGFRAQMPEVLIKASAWDADVEKAKNELDLVVGQIKQRVGEFIYSENELDTLEKVLVLKLRELGKTVAFAESCTGGLVANRLTNVSGSSEVFLAGVVSYSNEAKKNILSVPEVILNESGAVSEACVQAMVQGIKRISNADFCAAVTGIAGPTGGTDTKPVGTVHIAWILENELVHEKFFFPYERKIFKEIVASVVFKRILEKLGVFGAKRS